MEYVVVVLFLLALLAVLGLHVLTLPANWVLLGGVILWGWAHPELQLGIGFYLLLAGIALLGEAIEFASQYIGGKKYGATGKGNLGAFIGAILGAITCAPLFFGLGAVLGAVGGAYFGCFLFERIHGRETGEAWRAAKGAMLGRVLGLIVKIGLGGVMFAMAARAVWPKAQQVVVQLGF